MSAPYTTKWFLLHAKSALLSEYFRGCGVLVDFPFIDLSDGATEALLPALEGLTEGSRIPCERDFRDIHRLGDRAGRDAIVAVTRSTSLRRPDDDDFIDTIGAAGSYLDQAFWTFLNRAEYFEAALLLVEVDAVSVDGWEQHPAVPRIEPLTGEAATNALAEAISKYFIAVEGRSTRCEVHCVEVGDRYCFQCVFEGPYVARSTWEPIGLRRRVERSAAPLLFVYEKRRGTLNVHLRGGARIKWDMMSIFAMVILGSKKLDPPSSGNGSYALDRFKRRGHHFKVPPGSGISTVSVSRLRLTPRLGPKRHFNLQAQPFGRSQPVYDMLENELASLKPDECDVTQVELKVVFDKAPHRRKRTIPTVLTKPNRCSIGYDDQELIVRRMLIDSGIAPKDAD